MSGNDLGPVPGIHSPVDIGLLCALAGAQTLARSHILPEAQNLPMSWSEQV